VSAAATPYIGAAVVGNDGSASPDQAAAITGLSTLLGGLTAGALGQNVQGAATAAENEAQNNCNLHDCWQKVVDAWNSASGTVTNALNSAGSNVAAWIASPAGMTTLAMMSTNADIGGVAGEEAGAIEGAEGAFAAEEASLLANAATATGSGVPNSLSGLANPNSIRFTQSSISSTFSDGSSLQEAIGALQSGVLSPSDLPPIRVYEKDGLIYTLDNRRLFVTSQAGTMVNITPATPQQVTSQAWKFTTPNQGCIICIRGVPKE